MSDGIAPAIDKVGEPERQAPEARAGAPTLHTTAPTTDQASSKEKKSEEEKPEGKPEKKPEPNADATPKLPKPVEVTSVPQTPLNNQTPVGGTPRPELNIDEEPEKKPEEEARVILGPAEDIGEKSNDNPIESDTNGASEDIELRDAPASETNSESAKRKLDEKSAVHVTANGDISKEEKQDLDERAGKKARVEDAPAPTSTHAATNGKTGRTKRDKKTEPTIGRTARKTRSQGPVEV